MALRLAKWVSTNDDSFDASLKRNLVEHIMAYLDNKAIKDRHEALRKSASAGVLRELERFGVDKCHVDSPRLKATVRLVTREKASVSAKKLLELGVDPAIVEAATTRTTYSFADVRDCS